MAKRECFNCQNSTRRNNKYCDGCIAAGSIYPNKHNSSEKIKTAASLRRYLLRTRDRVCQSCELRNWLDGPIPLEVEHMNGNSTDNSEDNLKLLCPNCHALTPTYKNKNKGNGRHYRRDRYAQGLSF